MFAVGVESRFIRPGIEVMSLALQRQRTQQRLLRFLETVCNRFRSASPSERLGVRWGQKAEGRSLLLSWF